MINTIISSAPQSPGIQFAYQFQTRSFPAFLWCREGSAGGEGRFEAACKSRKLSLYGIKCTLWKFFSDSFSLRRGVLFVVRASRLAFATEIPVRYQHCHQLRSLEGCLGLIVTCFKRKKFVKWTWNCALLMKWMESGMILEVCDSNKIEIYFTTISF